MATFFKAQSRRLAAAGLVLLASLSAAGCSNDHATYPVHGQIVYSDGSPATDLEGYTVTFESVDHAATGEQSGIGAWGTVQSDGTFTLGTYESDDGAVLGKHRVAISPEPQLSDGPTTKPPIPLKYASVETSGMEVEVTRGKNNTQLTVERE